MPGKSNNLQPFEGKYKFSIDDHILADSWIYCEPGKMFFDSDFLKIVDFFCLHSPCSQGSYSPRSLEKIGWQNPWKSKKFRNKLKSIAEFDERNFVVSHYQHTFREAWEKSGYPDEFTRVRAPFAFLASAGESNDYLNLFHRIRNAFAHGRFNVIKERGEYYIYFEDVKTSNGCTYVLARICLTKSILSAWREFLNIEGSSAIGFESIIVQKKELITV